MLGLRQHPMGWMRVDTILERSSQDSTRYFALSILEDAIKLRWREMPPDQREGVKNFVMTKCIELSETQESLAANSRFLQKLNLVLVQILKHEWPDNWPTFIPDICGASQSRPSWCENNMHILLLLSEEIFEFSKEEITSEKALRLKERLDAEFEQIFKLCEFILRSDGVAESLLVRASCCLGAFCVYHAKRFEFMGRHVVWARFVYHAKRFEFMGRHVVWARFVYRAKRFKFMGCHVLYCFYSCCNIEWQNEWRD